MAQAPKTQPRWKRRRRIAALCDRLKRIRTTRRTLTLQEAAARRKRDSRRKFLTGLEVFWRLQVRPALTGLIRRMLREELGADHQKSFGLDQDAPLLPERTVRSIRSQRRAPGRPDDDPAAAPPDSPRVSRMSSARRRLRIRELEREEAELAKELNALLTEDRQDKDAVGAPNHELILLGAALHKRARRRHGVTRWLRVLLRRNLRAARDRKLFRLDQPGDLVPDEDVEEEETAERGRAKKKKGTASTSGTRSADAKRRGSAPPSAAVSEGVEAGRRSCRPTVGGVDAAAPPDAAAPIPGWRPRRISAEDSSEAGARAQRPDWGAILKGRAAVAALPPELPGRTITVTDSNGDSWNTVITEVVSRDDGSVLVRNSGRPRAGAPIVRDP